MLFNVFQCHRRTGQVQLHVSDNMVEHETRKNLDVNTISHDYLNLHNGLLFLKPIWILRNIKLSRPVHKHA